jgi:hypothetical protein
MRRAGRPYLVESPVSYPRSSHIIPREDRKEHGYLCKFSAHMIFTPLPMPLSILSSGRRSVNAFHISSACRGLPFNMLSPLTLPRSSPRDPHHLPCPCKSQSITIMEALSPRCKSAFTHMSIPPKTHPPMNRARETFLPTRRMPITGQSDGHQDTVDMRMAVRHPIHHTCSRFPR